MKDSIQQPILPAGLGSILTMMFKLCRPALWRGAATALFLLLLPALGWADNAPPKVGDKAADFELTSASGDKVKLSNVVEKGPVVLIVLRGYPGYQCPACNTQVVQLLEKEAKLKDAKANVLIVYPGPSKDLSKHADEFLKDKTIPDHFQLLLDPDFTFTKAYHLRWDAPQETAYPSTFVIQSDRKITFAKISKSHGGRTKPDEILKALTTPDKAKSTTQGASGKTASKGSSKSATNEATTKDTDESKLVERPSLPYLMLMLARDPAVQKDLELDRIQTEKVAADIALVDGPLWRLRDVPGEKCAEQLDLCLNQLRDALKRDLKKSQYERLEQIILLSRGVKAVAAPEVIRKLKLTDDQAARVKRAVIESVTEREKLDQDTSTPAAELAKAREKLNKTEWTRITDILNAKQEKDLTALLGKSFDFNQIQQIGCIAPELVDVEAWINSEPLTLQSLRGKVVVVHIYAFGCINCIRNLPHYQGWHEKFSPDDLTIIGIQTPETDSERNLDLLKKNVKERGIAYPVAFDLRSENWKAWGNSMWPTVYLIDKKGQVRNWWRGELNWQGAKGEEFFRKRIADLIAEK